jgi:hypothetical protein
MLQCHDGRARFARTPPTFYYAAIGCGTCLARKRAVSLRPLESTRSLPPTRAGLGHWPRAVGQRSRLSYPSLVHHDARSNGSTGPAARRSCIRDSAPISGFAASRASVSRLGLALTNASQPSQSSSRASPQQERAEKKKCNTGVRSRTRDLRSNGTSATQLFLARQLSRRSTLCTRSALLLAH